MANAGGNPGSGKAAPHLWRVQKRIHQRLVDIAPKHADGYEIPLRNQRSEFKPWQIKQEDMHRCSQVLLDGALAHMELGNECHHC